jgi:uncharacterized Fe-S cluster protein YjdI/CDGSH-type Zn-finger protein
MTIEQRHVPRVARVYKDEGIEVRWEPLLCVHTGHCARQLPNVFRPRETPWIHPEEASADVVASIISNCPSGALTFVRTDGGPQETPADPTTVEPQPNGPLYLRGKITVVGPESEVLRTATRVALCRCGNSQNKPYCDLSHRASAFEA